MDGGNTDNIKKIKITSYEPAFGIIGDPAKRNPQSRQSADHSMVYIMATLLNKAFERNQTIGDHLSEPAGLWKHLMLLPTDYGHGPLWNPVTRKLMETIEFYHGGDAYDADYPKGIPGSIIIDTHKGDSFDSGYVLYPGGHAANKDVSLSSVLKHKFVKMGSLGLKSDDLTKFIMKLENIGEMTNEQLADIYDCDINFAKKSIDDE